MNILSILPKDSHIKIRLLNITYKTIESNSPSYLLDLLNFKQNELSLRINDKQLLIIPRYCMKRYGYR